MRMTAILIALVPLATAPAAQAPMPSHGRSTAAAPSGAREMARVNGVPVTGDRVAAALSTLIPQESFHRNVSEERMAALRSQALAAVIDEELQYQDGIRRGLTAADADVQAAWKQTVARYGGPTAFAEALRKAGIDRTAVRREIERQLVLEKSYATAVLNRCAVTREDAARFFRENPDRFVEPEQLHVFAVTIAVDPSSNAAQWRDAKTRAEQARRALDAGAPFADVARTYSTDASRDKGGDLGFVHRGSLASPFEDIVKALPAGRPSDVVESIYGYHVVLVSEVRPPRRKTFEQVSSTLVKDLAARRCGERRTSWIASLRAAARIETLEPVQ